MSIRQTQYHPVNTHAAQLKADLESLRATHFRNEAIEAEQGSELTLNDLNETERSAAMLGVDPSDFKPIAFMNNAHYSALLEKNVLSGPLAQKVEAYRAVSDGQGSCPGC